MPYAGTCEIQRILPGSAIISGFIIGQESASGSSYEDVLQGLLQLAGTMNGPLNSNLINALIQGFPSGTTVSEVLAKVLTDYDPNNIQPLPVPQKDTIVFTNEFVNATLKNRCLLNSTGAFVDCINAGLDGYEVVDIAIDPNKQWVTFAGVPSGSEFFLTNATYTCPLSETGIVDEGKCRVTSTTGSEYYETTLYDPFARRVWFSVGGFTDNNDVLSRRFTNAGPFRRPSKFGNALAQEDNFAFAQGIPSYVYLKTCEIDSNGDYINCQMSEKVTDSSWSSFPVTGSPDASGFYLLNGTIDNKTPTIALSFCSNSLTLPCPMVTGIPYEEKDTVAIFNVLFISSKVAYIVGANITNFELFPLQRCSVKSPTEFSDCSAVESPFIGPDTFIELLNSANEGSNMYVLSNSTSLNVCDVDPAGSLNNCKVAYSDLIGAAFSEPVVF